MLLSYRNGGAGAEKSKLVETISLKSQAGHGHKGAEISEEIALIGRVTVSEKKRGSSRLELDKARVLEDRSVGPCPNCDGENNGTPLEQNQVARNLEVKFGNKDLVQLIKDSTSVVVELEEIPNLDRSAIGVNEVGNMDMMGKKSLILSKTGTDRVYDFRNKRDGKQLVVGGLENVVG
ncbi:hypothetical protein Q3G72_021727 [Acer saccharum]|nr:hypothetical protein Q3G72_021727 [Acer saccharum]